MPGRVIFFYACSGQRQFSTARFGGFWLWVRVRGLGSVYYNRFPNSNPNLNHNPNRTLTLTPILTPNSSYPNTLQTLTITVTLTITLIITLTQNSTLTQSAIYTTKIDGIVCPPNISETVAVRTVKLAHPPRIASTTIKFISKPILLSIL